MTIIDPPSGWMYGFPKEIPDSARQSDKSFIAWLARQNYPKDLRMLALKHSRYWEVDE
jgi:hypothetical protein